MHLDFTVVARVLVLATAVALTHAQSPTVLRDIDARPAAEFDSGPAGFVRLGGTVLFSATEPATGHELWRLDLATGAVAQVKDLWPGLGSGLPGGFAVLGNHACFVADDGVHGRELWRTDGTEAGTTLVRDLAPGSATSSIRELVQFGNAVLFVASAGAGFEVWRTDGTAAGTALVVDLVPGSTGSFPSELTVHNGEVWFSATTGATGYEAWRTDGTAAGTVLVADLVAGSAGSSPRHFVSHGTVMLFGAASGLWRSDGTPAGTTSIGALLPSSMVSDGTTAWLCSGASVYTTDGTAANTRLVATLGGVPFAATTQLVLLGSRALFRHQSSLGATTLWVSDGTAAGTMQVHGGVTPYANHAVLGTQLLFSAAGGNGAELWRTDGTVAGTVEVLDIAPSGGSLPAGLTTIPGTGIALFSADDGVHGREPWRTDGTGAGTALVANVADGSSHTLSSRAEGFVDAAGIVYFAAADDGGATTLWRTDGTPNGTHAVVPPGPGRPADVQKLCAVGTRVFFVASHATSGIEPWVSDGTVAGTHLLLDTNPQGDSNPGSFTAAEGLVYFDAFGSYGRALWRSDGTPQGTVVLTPWPLGNTGAKQALGRGLVFVRYDIGTGWEPWYTDGTVAGTVQLADLAPGPSPSDPADLVAYRGRCYFTALGNSVLYVTDGTAAGTQPFVDLMPGTGDFYDDLRVVGETLFFSARSPLTGAELWRTDGTVAGSSLVLDASPGAGGTFIQPHAALGDLLLYTAQLSGSAERGLWRSDGTAAGTFRIPGQETLRFVSPGDGHAWFSGRDVGGFELWRTDGTVAGTGRFADLYPGETSSSPNHLRASTGRLLFAAAHPQFGVEPWVHPLGATATPVGHACVTSHRVPYLVAERPVLGSTFAMRLRQGPPQGLGIALVSLHTTASFRLPGGRCDLFLDPAFVVLGLPVLQAGGFDVPWTLPADPAFAGIALRAQALLLPNAGLVGVEASNALSLVLGT